MSFDDNKLNYDETNGVAESLESLSEDAHNVELVVSLFAERAEEGSNSHAHSLFAQAAVEMENAVRSICAAHAFVEFARSQMRIEQPEMTALTAIPREVPKLEISPIAGFWAEGPVWLIYNSPLKGAETAFWSLFIGDDRKHLGEMNVVAFAYFGGNKQRAIPISTVTFKHQAPELEWTVAQWVEYAQPIAESYIAAFDPELTEEIAAPWQKLYDAYNEEMSIEDAAKFLGVNPAAIEHQIEIGNLSSLRRSSLIEYQRQAKAAYERTPQNTSYLFPGI